MIRSVCAVAGVALLLAGAVLFEHWFVGHNFSGFCEELTALCEKTETQSAHTEDARAVRASWEARKEKLQAFLPHNDLARIDIPLSEAVRLIGEGEYAFARTKLEALIQIAASFPQSYRASLANNF